MEFKEWFIELIEYANEKGLPVNLEDPESYREYFEDGYTPRDAIEEDFSNL